MIRPNADGMFGIFYFGLLCVYLAVFLWSWVIQKIKRLSNLIELLGGRFPRVRSTFHASKIVRSIQTALRLPSS